MSNGSANREQRCLQRQPALKVRVITGARNGLLRGLTQVEKSRLYRECNRCGITSRSCDAALILTKYSQYDYGTYRGKSTRHTIPTNNEGLNTLTGRES